jgi:large subunit ribosomal protein L29
MKISEIKSLSLDEIKERIAAEEANLTKLRFAHAITPIENPMKIRDSRKTIARLKTELKAKQLAN